MSKITKKTANYYKSVDLKIFTVIIELTSISKDVENGKM